MKTGKRPDSAHNPRDADPCLRTSYVLGLSPVALLAGSRRDGIRSASLGGVLQVRAHWRVLLFDAHPNSRKRGLYERAWLHFFFLLFLLIIAVIASASALLAFQTKKTRAWWAETDSSGQVTPVGGDLDFQHSHRGTEGFPKNFERLATVKAVGR